MFVNWLTRCALSVAVLSGLLVSTNMAADAAKQERETVEMFAAIESGDIEVMLIPKDAKQANVVVTNKTKKPLSVKMPEAFAGVPVLAQFGGGGLGGGGLGGGGLGGGLGGGGNQGVGGGFGGGGLGGGGLGGGGLGGGGGAGGFFNVEPEKARKVKVAVMCLEHGKKDPNLNVKYQIVPIDTFTDKAEVIEVCKMLGRGEVDQVAAQAAVWNLANEISWQELAAKVGVKHLNGSTEPFFTLAQIQLGMKIGRVAEERAAAIKSDSAKGSKSDSLSQK